MSYPMNIRCSQRKMHHIFPDFVGNSHAQKLNKAHTKRANTTGVQYFGGIWSYVGIIGSGVNVVLSLILYALHFLTICANFPFCFRLHHHHIQSTSPPWFGWVCESIQPRCSPNDDEANLTTTTTPAAANLSVQPPRFRS